MSEIKPKTELEFTDELSFRLEERFKDVKDQLNQCVATDTRFSVLNLELERIKEQVDYMQDERKRILSSGITKYVYEYGSREDVLQAFKYTDFSEHYLPEHLFALKTKWILEKENTPSKKIKMLNILLQVYEEYTSASENWNV
ncbi:hypothetical protein OM416_20145 [Paenibacillus sp. LS1]|uniref:hypothetical protein n=1 Tax=Paenibacillus sp. LS1 TaxID=2992120 RepID=UPI0022316A8A|nr:hypothetical protein [Paenibacillus sp. LS1]MCW3793908.1 hypothetical protein [Paenibacillus sp. LS1]